MKNMLLSEIIPDFLIAKEVEEGCSQNTIKAYNYDLQILLKHLSQIDVDKIQIFHIRKVLKYFYEKQYSKRAIARKIACYKSFFQFCVDNELLLKNPMRAIKSPKISQQETLPKYLSLEDIQTIFGMLDKWKGTTNHKYCRLKVIIRLMYASLARISEICNLNIQDIDISNRSIKVTGKGNKERYIPIDFTTAKYLAEFINFRQMESSEEYTPLFINSRNKRISPRTIQRDLQELKEHLGFPKEKKFTPHIFRHSGATHLRQNGMDISELQDLLGHANPNTTRIYAKNDISRLKKSYDEYHPLALNS
ncbi:Tyrosine recombinase XerA [Candidatus Lokiarchaeum ossiferum]